MTELKSGFICRIINQELNLAWDLSREDKTSVVGAQPNESFTQRVRPTAIDDPSNLSNLGSVSSQWKIEHIDGYWTIENVSNEKFANVESVDPIRPGVKVVTANQRNWEFRFDHEFDGWR